MQRIGGTMRFQIDTILTIYSSYIIFLTVGKIHEYLGTIKLINVLEIIFIKKKPPQLSFEIYNLRLEKIVEEGKCTYPGKHSPP